jgi:hypothetical protein
VGGVIEYTYLTRNPYGRATDFFGDPVSAVVRGRNLKEGKEVATDSGFSFTKGTDTVPERTAPVYWLESDGWINTNNPKTAFDCHGSVFGPELWSEPFQATAGEGVSFDWAATGGFDDFESYGFLVKLDTSTSYTGTTTLMGLWARNRTALDNCHRNSSGDWMV